MPSGVHCDDSCFAPDYEYISNHILSKETWVSSCYRSICALQCVSRVATLDMSRDVAKDNNIFLFIFNIILNSLI